MNDITDAIACNTRFPVQATQNYTNNSNNYYCYFQQDIVTAVWLVEKRTIISLIVKLTKSRGLETIYGNKYIQNGG
jgi:hypothetical protein